MFEIDAVQIEEIPVVFFTAPLFSKRFLKV